MAVGSLSSHVFERRTSTGSEPFSRLVSLDATVFVLPSVLILTETICPKICSKSGLKCAKSQFPVDVRRSKTSLLKLPSQRLTPHTLDLLVWAKAAPLHFFSLHKKLSLSSHSLRIITGASMSGASKRGKRLSGPVRPRLERLKGGCCSLSCITGFWHHTAGFNRFID